MWEITYLIPTLQFCQHRNKFISKVDYLLLFQICFVSGVNQCTPRSVLIPIAKKRVRNLRSSCQNVESSDESSLEIGWDNNSPSPSTCAKPGLFIYLFCLFILVIFVCHDVICTQGNILLKQELRVVKAVRFFSGYFLSESLSQSE